MPTLENWCFFQISLILKPGEVRSMDLSMVTSHGYFSMWNMKKFVFFRKKKNRKKKEFCRAPFSLTWMNLFYNRTVCINEYHRIMPFKIDVQCQLDFVVHSFNIKTFYEQLSWKRTINESNTLYISYFQRPDLDQPLSVTLRAEYLKSRAV